MARRSIVESVFRRLLREAVDPANRDAGVWGKYAFGTDRQDVPYEEDTPDERAARRALIKHVYKNESLAEEDVMLIWDAMETGLYGDILHEPSTEYVYRAIVLPQDAIERMIGRPLTPEEVGGEKPGFGSAMLKGPVGRKTDVVNDPQQSTAWTTDLKFASIWNATSSHAPFDCVLVASVSENPFTFIEGPGGFYKVGVLENYATEKETIALGSVKGVKIYWHNIWGFRGVKFPIEAVTEKNR